jgi:hypothetical protein
VSYLSLFNARSRLTVFYSKCWTSEAPIFHFHCYIKTFCQAYPDVSAQGDNFKVFIEGQATLVAGTSCSSPTFTGIISLLNDARLKAHLPPMGFLNPFLYSKGFAGLNDITVGHNAGCGTEGFNVSNDKF